MAITISRADFTRAAFHVEKNRSEFDGLTLNEARMLVNNFTGVQFSENAIEELYAACEISLKKRRSPGSSKEAHIKQLRADLNLLADVVQNLTDDETLLRALTLIRDDTQTNKDEQ